MGGKRNTSVIRDVLERLRPSYVAITIFCVLSAVSFPLYNRFYSNGLVDIGEYLNNPFRILRGELPYRDFWLFHPPGEVFLPYSLYRIFGPLINPILMVSVLINVLTGVLMFILARQFLKENTLAVLIALLTFFNGVPTEGGMSVALQTGHYLFFLVAAAIALAQFAEMNNLSALWLSGFGMACSFFLRLYDTLPAFVAFTVALFVHSGGARFKPPRLSALRSVGVFWVSVVSIYATLLLICLPVWEPAVWKPMAWETVVGGVKYYMQTFHDTQPWTYIVDLWVALVEKARVVFTTGSAVEVLKLGFRTFSFLNCLALYLLPILVTVFGVAAIRDRTLKPFQRTLFVAFLCWGLLSLAKACKYLAAYYWMFGTTPLLLVLGLLLQRIQFHRLVWMRRLTVGVTSVLACSIPLGISIAAFRVATVNEQIEGPYGSIRVEDQRYARTLQRVIGTIVGNTKARDHIFIEPFHVPPLYVMTGRFNSSFYDSLQILYVTRLAGLPTERYERNICQEITSHDTRVVLTNEASISKYQSLQRCIETKFDFLERFDDYKLYAKPMGFSASPSRRH